MSAQNHAGGEQRKANHRQEENDVARIEHAFLESFKMGHDTEGRNDVDEGGSSKLLQEINNRRETGQNQQQADNHRDDKADNLRASHGRSDATEGQVSPCHQPTTKIR